MLYGEGVLGKYSVIISGRQQELYSSVPAQERHTIANQLDQFKTTIRSCSMREFNEWYEIYKDAYAIPERKRRSASSD